MTGTFLDTNVLVYVFDDDAPAKQRRAKGILAGHDLGDLTLSTQILGEFYVAVTRKLSRPLDPHAAYEAVQWLSGLHVVPIDVELTHSAARTSRVAQISYWDGLVLSAAARGGCERVLTEDLNDGQRFGSVRVENPFAGHDRQ